MMTKVHRTPVASPKTLFLALMCALLMPLMVRCQQKESATKEKVQINKDFNPAMPGFDSAGSDQKAIEIADRVMKNMGGYQAWHDTRFIAWSFYGQYNIWDKHTGWFRHEREKMVSIINLHQPEIRLYLDGIPRTDDGELKTALQQTQIFWMANVYWLALPYKLKDSGVTLKYIGEDKTQDGRDADVLQMTFSKVGLTPQNMHRVWVDKERGLVTQWAFYNDAADEEPTFIRRFADYQTFGKIKLSLNRDSNNDELRVTDVVVTDHLPKRTFFSSVPVSKERVKEEAQQKPEEEKK